MSETIPILDLAGPRARLAAELKRAFTEVGFTFVVNHAVPEALVQAAFDAAAAFHAQPLEAKLALKIDAHNIGYMPMRGATTRFNSLGETYAPNANEAVFIKRELAPDHPDVLAGLRFRGLNRWPAALPEFRATALAYFAAMERLGLSLLPLYAGALGLAEDFFAAAFDEPMATLRMSHYPPAPPTAPGNEYGLAPHTDTSFMTILAQNKVPGLAIRLADGRWIDAPAPEGAFLVNGGNMLRRWTNDTFLATPHRVTNRSGQERYAIPFFMDSAYHAVIAPVPGTGAPKYPPTTYAEYMLGYQQANYAHAAKDSEGVALQGA